MELVYKMNHRLRPSPQVQSYNYFQKRAPVSEADPELWFVCGEQ